MEKIQLNSIVEDKKRKINKLIKKDEAGDMDYKDNFLIKFLD